MLPVGEASNVASNTEAPLPTPPRTPEHAGEHPIGPSVREAIRQRVPIPSHRSSTTTRQSTRNALGPRTMVTSDPPTPVETNVPEPAPVQSRSMEHTTPGPTTTGITSVGLAETENQLEDDQEPPPDPVAKKTPYQQRRTRAETVLREMGTFSSWEKIGGIMTHRSNAAEPSAETQAKIRDMPASSNTPPQSRQDQIRQQARFAYLSKPPPNPQQTTTDIPLAGYSRPCMIPRDPMPKARTPSAIQVPPVSPQSTPCNFPPDREFLG